MNQDNRPTLSNLIQANDYQSEIEVCPGCENHCTVRLFHFQNGNTFFSGNNCEKVYSNTTEGTHKGVNMFADKFRLLFNRSADMPADAPTIGIPRGLGIYENYPFWHTLFTACDIQLVLSPLSTNKIYEKGIRSIIDGQADALIFPDIVAGNVFYKTITLFGYAKTAGVLQGTQCCCVLPSRADSPDSKYYSLALAAI